MKTSKHNPLLFLRLLIILLFIIINLSCKETIFETPIISSGSLYLDSNPQGASIYLQGTNTGKVTPDSIQNLHPDSYEVKLELNGVDTTFIAEIKANLKTSHFINFSPSFGSLFVSSIPSGAQIWVNGVNTIKATPDTVKELDPGVYGVTLKLTDYKDTTFSVSVSSNQTSAVTNVMLVSNISTSLYGPVRIYESFGSSAQQPSGLDLSSGNTWGTNSDSSGVIDIYYSTIGTGGQGYLIQSADLYPNLIRVTDFFVGSGAANNLFDGVDSPLRSTGTWTNNIDDRQSKYVFIYDQDGHYSKLKIVRWGGGTGLGDPSWVDVQWYYNKTVNDNRF
ncbi:MAG: PEGA domain-containing protein [Ignavibacteriaceae bacterium]